MEIQYRNKPKLQLLNTTIEEEQSFKNELISNLNTNYNDLKNYTFKNRNSPSENVSPILATTILFGVSFKYIKGTFEEITNKYFKDLDRLSAICFMKKLNPVEYLEYLGIEDKYYFLGNEFLSFSFHNETTKKCLEYINYCHLSDDLFLKKEVEDKSIKDHIVKNNIDNIKDLFYLYINGLKFNSFFKFKIKIIVAPEFLEHFQEKLEKTVFLGNPNISAIFSKEKMEIEFSYINNEAKPVNKSKIDLIKQIWS